MNKNNDKHKPGQGECLCKHRLFVPKTPCLSGLTPNPYAAPAGGVTP